MQEIKYITIISSRKKIVLSISTILYVIMNGKRAEIHVFGSKVYNTRMTLGEIEEKLGNRFIKIHRGCIVSAMAIHNITDTINLNNGEILEYTMRKKSWIIEQFQSMQKDMLSSFTREGIPITAEEYRQYYSSFENLPFAFTDIEMIFNEKSHAVDWIFRYGNPALAKLEKLPLEQLIGSTFSSLFSNMDAKWLQSYERATLYGEILTIIDYSPEIDTFLKVISFPTFKGHCGCILLNIEEIKFAPNNSDIEKVLMLYLEKLAKKNT